MISHEKATQLIAKLNTKASKLVFPSQNFIDLTWKDKPLRPKDPIFVQSLDFTGRAASSKLAEVRQWIRAQPPAMPTHSKSPPTAAQAHVGTIIASLSSIGM
jgi:Xaa-Pro aminopeptidase